MSKKFFTSLVFVSIFALTVCTAQAYTQNSIFGTGYGFAGYNNFDDGAIYSKAINSAEKDLNKSKTKPADIKYNFEKNVSNVYNGHDEAPNAGYKTTYTYIEKDMSDYNPYTGADAGVNDSKSIYTDDLGRLHFFGKGSLVK
ncbi:MAG: hypothetical protein MJ230_00505 [bacterium]|nr:hypothetical protein [bacterium]